MTQRWLLKSDPDTYGWSDLVRDGKTRWDGVRNFQARNFLRQMKMGDRAWFYHSQSEKAVVGLVEIVRAAYPDPTAKAGDWSCVDICPVKVVRAPVPLEEMRKQATLRDLSLIRQGRLSVMPVSPSEWSCIERLAYGA